MKKSYINKINEHFRKNSKVLNNDSFKKENFYKILRQKLIKITNGN